jgi:hypothetical protein
VASCYPEECGEGQETSAHCVLYDEPVDLSKAFAALVVHGLLSKLLHVVADIVVWASRPRGAPVLPQPSLPLQTLMRLN